MNWFKSFWRALTTPMPREAVGSTKNRRSRLAQPVPPPYEPVGNFTPRAQQVLTLARKEADRFHHNFVGTEHVLLGLISLGQGTAVTVLSKLGLDLDTVRSEVEKQVGMGPDQKMIGHIPYTPRVKKVLALAAKEAQGLNHNYVGTEHILLGLLREGDGVAGRILMHFGVGLEQTRREILRELDPNQRLNLEDLTAQDATVLPELPSDSIDIRKRYDIYCIEGVQTVVYSNALFKGTKRLFARDGQAISNEFLELEKADGQAVFISSSSVYKICEHGIGTSPAPPTQPAPT